MPKKIILICFLCFIVTATLAVFVLQFRFALRNRTYQMFPNDLRQQIPQGTKDSISIPVGTKENVRISLESIFQYEDPTLEESSANSNIYTLLATGDVILARSVNAKMVQLNDYLYPFRNVAGFLKKGNTVFINLESPFISSCPTTVEGMMFCGNEKGVEGLKYAGVAVANIANNHMGNHGTEGIDNTVHLLNENNILVTGSGGAAVINVKGRKIGFLGYNDIGGKEEGIAWADKDQIKHDVENLRKTVDLVIVAFHWGIEYTLDPTDRQIELAHTSIDAGADLIIGNHPHWVQGIEQYKGKFITYAHGNFVFDQMWSRETREGVIGKYVFDKDELISVKFYPVIIEDYSQPRFATTEEATKILNRMKQASLKLSK